MRPVLGSNHEGFTSPTEAEVVGHSDQAFSRPDELNISNHNSSVDLPTFSASQSVQNSSAAVPASDSGGNKAANVSRIPVVKSSSGASTVSGMRSDLGERHPSAKVSVDPGARSPVHQEDLQVQSQGGSEVHSTVFGSAAGARHTDAGMHQLSGVRNSKSHENYLESNKQDPGLQCVDIDFEDNIATSVDALHYHEQSNGVEAAERHAKSLDSSPEKQETSGKYSTAEKVLMPTFISLDEPRSRGGKDSGGRGKRPGCKSPRTADGANEEQFVMLEERGESSTDPVDTDPGFSRQEPILEACDDGVWLSIGALREALSNTSSPQHKTTTTTTVEINSHPRASTASPRTSAPAQNDPQQQQPIKPPSPTAHDQDSSHVTEESPAHDVSHHVMYDNDGGACAVTGTDHISQDERESAEPEEELADLPVDTSLGKKEMSRHAPRVSDSFAAETNKPS